ncbi:microsomal glutathione S-transferase 1-like [Saccoglossus kowalevskii]|uniref:Microsomal glutathione S-transferase 1 n=1 Tax=Saccoglossus kowalevskii TaxID=10224 RepID=A0ABM0MZ58_SACKO|nr:PREDICTED: microsomal glutathione S-transferase 1-like [Saccoglossus kowalevskii]
MADIFHLDNDVFRSYLACGTVIIVKMMALSLFTTYRRFKYKAFSNPEDTKRPVTKHEDVERVRRLHRNDLENIPVFLALGCMYIATEPVPSTAIWHFRVFAISRILHSISYLAGIQPWRVLVYSVGFLVNASMAYHILCAAL